MWSTIETCPEQRAVMTKIDDGDGCRNEQPLVKRGRLFFFIDDSMYVYYRPTHWRELDESEKAKLRASIVKAGKAAAEKAEAVAASI